MAGTSFELRPVPPFRLDLTVCTLRRRTHNIVDRWDGYGGLVYFHLLLDRLAQAGNLDEQVLAAPNLTISAFALRFNCQIASTGAARSAPFTGASAAGTMSDWP
jgi:hypothetical protein